MKITKKHIVQLVKEELTGKSHLLEEMAENDIQKIRNIIRREIAAVFFELFKKRSVWI